MEGGIKNINIAKIYEGLEVVRGHEETFYIEEYPASTLMKGQ